MLNARSIKSTLFSLVTLAAIVSACSDKPAAPVFDNPFDPRGTGPDPFDLRATVVGSSIELRWPEQEQYAISDYAIWWSTEGPPTGEEGDQQLDDPVTGPERGFFQLIHQGYAPNRPNWYRVQANPGTSGSSLSVTAAALVTPPPRVVLADGATSTPTRFVQLEVASDAGDSVELAHEADFSDARGFGIVAPDILLIDWALPKLFSSPDTVEIFVRGLAAGIVGVSGQAYIAVTFAPGPVTASGSTSIADTTVTLLIDDLGVERMRFALSEEELPTAPWQPGAPSTVLRWPVDIAQSRNVYAEFESDFGFSVTNSNLTLTPVLTVESASMEIDGGEEVTFSRTVEIVSSATGASYMRLSEDPSFADTPFVDYADTTIFELISPGGGEKSVYGQFINPWDTPGRGAVARITLLGGAKR